MGEPERIGVYEYVGEQGLAAAARIADPDTDDDLPSEMRELDLRPGTEVTLIEHDLDRDLLILEWTDASGGTRRTSVPPAQFDAQFEEVA